MTANPREIIDSLKEIKVQKPAEVIIKQIEHLIVSGALKPGDRLPAERAFAEKFGVGRGHVREALKKLEFSGILKTLPQSGTFVADFTTKALEGLMSSVLDAEENNLDAVLETRLILEVNAARLAAEKVATEDLIDLIRIHEQIRKQAKDRAAGVAGAHRFHLKIAECSKNPVLCGLIALIIQNLVSTAHPANRNTGGQTANMLSEHEQILQAIKQKDPDRAAYAMEVHMEAVINRFHDMTVSS